MSVQKKKAAVQPSKKTATTKRTSGRRNYSSPESAVEIPHQDSPTPVESQGPTILPVDEAANRVSEIILSLPIEARAAALQGAMDYIRRQTNYEMRVTEEQVEWARVGARKLKALIV